MLPCLHASEPPRLPATLLLAILMLFSTLLPAQSTTSYVVMLSMDGFRWDFPDIYPTPNLDRLSSAGVKALSLQPAFPTKTFPNHYTMVTGLYPDHHGIVQNEFFDAATGKYYRIGDREAVENPAFYGGEPIWATAEKNGITTASFFWVGSEAAIEGIQPTYWKRYDGSIPYGQRIDTVIYWLSLPESVRPHLITWYIDEPDNTEHDKGPLSNETKSMVIYLDSLVGVFLNKLDKLPVASEVNVIITSDHGMGEIKPERTVYLSKYIEKEWFDRVEGYSPNYILDVKDEHAEQAWEALIGIPHVQVWKYGQVPEWLHYGTNPRTRDFILVADSAWQVTFKEQAPKLRGAHGYVPTDKDMHAIFIAKGPAFKEGYIQSTFENIDLYALLCHLLDVEPAKNDGNLKNVRGMFKD
jgi:predicted AlkP superfamily pyrophosphatase or phosphodiesterase